jgi:hypothetical protein
MSKKNVAGKRMKPIKNPMSVCCGNGYVDEPHKGFDGKRHYPKKAADNLKPKE